MKCPSMKWIKWLLVSIKWSIQSDWLSVKWSIVKKILRLVVDFFFILKTTPLTVISEL
jgi:hypothetical protein